MVTARPESAHGPMEEYALTVIGAARGRGEEADLPSNVEALLRHLARHADEMHSELADVRRDLDELRSHAGLNVQRPVPLQVLERNGHSYIDLR